MTVTTKSPGTTEEKPERAACLCGCGGLPAKPTYRYLPGHDAKHHAALKRADKEQEQAKPKSKRGEAVAR